MKRFFFLALSAAILAVGCEKNQEGQTGDPFPSNNDGTAFMSFAINLPTAPATKANDVFDDGTVNEYAVENAYLVIFAGTPNADRTNEKEMTLRSAYELNSVGFNKDSGSEQITTSKTVTTEVFTENIREGEDAFAFVILNIHDFFEVKDSDITPGMPSLYNKMTGDDLMGKTFGDFKKVVLDEHNKDFSNQSFTMTNMPHGHLVGGASNPFNPTHPAPWGLSRIDKSKVQPTYQDALGQIAAEIDVERVVAKVSVSSSLTGAANTVENGLKKYGTTEEVKFEVLGWFIDNTNETAYVTRNSAEPTTSAEPSAPYLYMGYQAPGKIYRMASATAVRMEDSTTPVVRTFWGIDPNYNTNATGLKTEAGKIVDNTIMVFNDAHVLQSGRLRALGTSYYCAENTFDVEHMTVRNTTRVVVATRFNGGESFFTLRPAPGFIFTKANLEAQIKTILLSRVNVSNWVSEYLTAGDNAIVVTVTGLGKDTAAEGTATVTVQLAGDDVLNTIKKSTKTLHAVKEAWGAIETDQITYVAENVTPTISFYETGVAYYQALIRHFNDDETPWLAATGMTNNVESIYDNKNAEKFLGRYGVLRNNWYDINISKVRTLGSPIVPPLTDDPDDVVESYITVKINVMPWAKRAQSVIL